MAVWLGDGGGQLVLLFDMPSHSHVGWNCSRGVANGTNFARRPR
jgi:hypothetical protein